MDACLFQRQERLVAECEIAGQRLNILIDFPIFAAETA
jgi:hypothetical protein